MSFLLCANYELCAEYKLLVAAGNASSILNGSLFERKIDFHKKIYSWEVILTYQLYYKP